MKMDDQQEICRIQEIGFRLQECRRRARMTQKEAATASGVGEKTISSYECGRRTESLKMRHIIALLLSYGVDFDEFFSAQTLVDAYVESLGGKRVVELIGRIGALRNPWRETVLRSCEKLATEAEVSQRRFGIANKATIASQPRNV